jgi:hypothetical protein
MVVRRDDTALWLLEMELEKSASVDDLRGRAMGQLEAIGRFLTAIGIQDSALVPYLHLVREVIDGKGGPITTPIGRSGGQPQPIQEQHKRAVVAAAVESFRDSGMNIRAACTAAANWMSAHQVPIEGRRDTSPARIIQRWREEATDEHSHEFIPREYRKLRAHAIKAMTPPADTAKLLLSILTRFPK